MGNDFRRNLLFGIQNYETHGLDYTSFLRGREAFDLAGKIDQDFTWALFQRGLLIGETGPLKRALQRDPNIEVTRDYDYCFIIENQPGVLVPAEMEIQFSADYVEWQKWRIKGIREGSYSQEQFPIYSSIRRTATFQDGTRVRTGPFIHSNMAVSGLILRTLFPDCPSIGPENVKSVLQDPSQEHMYLSELVVPKTPRVFEWGKQVIDC